MHERQVLNATCGLEQAKLNQVVTTFFERYNSIRKYFSSIPSHGEKKRAVVDSLVTEELQKTPLASVHPVYFFSPLPAMLGSVWAFQKLKAQGSMVVAALFPIPSLIIPSVELTFFTLAKQRVDVSIELSTAAPVSFPRLVSAGWIPPCEVGE